jgi:two-component system cell cycle sensor histidine kinase/response regulator CckA
LDLVRTSAKRCADMVRQILSFTRGAGHGREPLNPAKVIEELASFARETFPRLITIHSQSEPGIRWIDGNVTQIHQVLMNLLINARDAIPAGGTIWITARNVFLRNQKTPMLAESATGPYVSICVRDTGTGIPSDVMDKIFEPFFTTKEPGKGTGLGLSTVYSIVKSHGGFLEVRSAPGQGTTFELFLPAHVDKTEPEPAAEIAKRPPAEGERLLVIDDEAGLLAVLKNTLEAIGFQVSTAASGLEAISLLEKPDAKFDVILTDWIMPILSGPDLIKRLRALAPESKIVVVTGSADVEGAPVRDSGIDGVLLKPYTTETLLAAISAALGKAETMQQV